MYRQLWHWEPLCNDSFTGDLQFAGTTSCQPICHPGIAAGYWANTSSNLPGPRADFVAVPLADERVFIVGGQDSSGNFLSSALIYDAVLDM